MTTWIGRAFRRGILTTGYPDVAATVEETPDTGRPPVGPIDRPFDPGPIARCPAGAIGTVSVDQGKCIRCARCVADRFAFAGEMEAAAMQRQELVRVSPEPAGGATPAAPLAALDRSLHLFLIDVGSCNACNLEVLGLANPYYDLQRLGLFFTNSPRHADVLLVVGVPTEEMLPALERAYAALPHPKAVVAVGACPISGGIFQGNPGVRSALDQIVPVSVYIPGCPPTPIAILDGLLRVIGRHRRPENDA